MSIDSSSRIYVEMFGGWETPEIAQRGDSSEQDPAISRAIEFLVSDGEGATLDQAEASAVRALFRQQGRFANAVLSEAQRIAGVLASGSEAAKPPPPQSSYRYAYGTGYSDALLQASTSIRSALDVAALAAKAKT